MALVIADNEAEMMAAADPMRSRDASYARATAALALSHLRGYEDQPEVLEAVCAEALGSPSARERVSSGATTPEWECGHLLACVAREHAEANLEEVYNRGDFAYEATVDLGDVRARAESGAARFASSGDRARLEGVNAGRRIMAAFDLSPQTVMDVARRMEGPVSITWSQADELATDFCDALAQVDLDSCDCQDLESRIQAAHEERQGQSAECPFEPGRWGEPGDGSGARQPLGVVAGIDRAASRRGLG